MLAILLAAFLPLCGASCAWHWGWSYQNPAQGANFPPHAPCLVHESDSVHFVNSDEENRQMFRVAGPAVDTCDTSQPLYQLDIPPNTSIQLNISTLGQVSSEVHLISDGRNGSCLKAAFTLTNQTLSGCDRCTSQGPCFRGVTLPLSQFRSPGVCQVAQSDWLAIHNTDTSPRLVTADFAPNTSWIIPPNSYILIPADNRTFSIQDSTASIPIQVLPQNLINCTSTLCSPMIAVPPLSPLAVSLVSLLAILGGLSVLLALCLRKKRAISTEEDCPPSPGETTGRYELKPDGKLPRQTEAKLRSKKSDPSPPEAPPADPEDPPREKMIAKRSSQFNELLSKFN